MLSMFFFEIFWTGEMKMFGKTPQKIESRGIYFTPWKINMEPTNHQFSKENDLPNLHDYVPC